MDITIFNLLLITGAIHGFLFIVIPILLKKRIGKPIWFLNGFVFFISANNLQAWISEKNYFSSLFYIKNLVVPWYMLVAPCFLSFVIYYLRVQKNVTSYLKLAMIFFIVESFIRVCLITYCSSNALDNGIIQNYTLFEELFNIIFTLFIFYKAYSIIFRKESWHHYNSSYTSIKWLKQFIIFGCIILIFWCFAIIANFLISDLNNTYTYYPLRLASSVLIYWTGYQGLIRYNLMVDRISLRREINKTISPKSIGLEKINVKKNKSLKTFKAIESYIIEHKRYLDPLFGLHNLAIEMELSASHLSKIINTHSNDNFSDYINKLRVDYAKKILIDNDYSEYSIIAIGLECGFNSKSTFYTAFKKFASQTPTMYRKTNIKS